MTTQINLRVSDDFLATAKTFAKQKGYLNVQEFIREAAREKLYEQREVRQEYLSQLKSKDAHQFLSEEESKEFEKKLSKQLMNETKKVQ